MTNKKIMEDGSGKKYIEVQVNREFIRLTMVPKDQAGYGEDSIRIQTKEENGHLRQGPEIPLSLLGDFAKGIFTLIT